MSPEGNKVWFKIWKDHLFPLIQSSEQCIIEGCLFQWYGLFPNIRSTIIKFPCVMLGKSRVNSVVSRVQRGDHQSYMKAFYKEFKSSKLYNMKKLYIKDKEKVATNITKDR